MTVSASTIERLHRTDDHQGVLVLLEMEHEALSGPVKLVSDTRDLMHNGETYIGLPFEVKFPNDTEKEMPRAQLRMENVGRDLTQELEGLPPGAALKATLKLVHRSTPDVVDYQFKAPLSGIRVDVATVVATMGPDDLMRKPAVLIRFDPTTAPGVFPD